MVFEEFVVPDAPVAAALLAGAGAVGVLLSLVRPQVSQRTVLAFVPWMVTGSVLHVLYQMQTALGESLLPVVPGALLSAPSVYVTTFLFLGVVWIPAARRTPERPERVARVLAVAGTVAAMSVGGYALWVALDRFALDPVLPVVGLLGSLALTALLYVGLARWDPAVTSAVRYVGALVLFAHVFDAITTAIGVELLDTGERSTFPRLVMEFAADLPTADVLGEAWLFVVLKVVIATGVVWLFHDYVEEQPTEGNLFFAVMAAVGLGPATHNFFLFALGV
jgi:uncharacterized membrane protein